MTTFDTESELHKIASVYPGIKLVLRVRCDDPEVCQQLECCLLAACFLLCCFASSSRTCCNASCWPAVMYYR